MQQRQAIKDKFKVIRDKENVHYKGVISNFMKDIGKSEKVILILNDKYFKSRFCMYELYEIFRNAKMDKDEFTKIVFPIFHEFIDLQDSNVINGYLFFWKEEEEKWRERLNDLTEEEFRQFQIIKNIVNELGNIMIILADINVLHFKEFSESTYELLRNELQKSINNI